MNVQINQLVRSLLQKDDIGQCSLQELQQFAEKNPYFGAAQLLLTKKLQTEDPARYDEQLQKTFLFFNNPLWVEQVLNGSGKATIVPAEKKPEPLTVLVPIEESSVMETTLQEEPAEVELITADPVIETAATEPVVQPLSEEPLADPAEQPEETAMEMPAFKMSQPAAPADPGKEEILFEPFHTVDYFASQGIKFREEEKPKDKFGQQLKSFTDWLKAMKRLPVSEIVKTVETHFPVNAEKKVEQLAEHSLAEREIVTEAMAEVWEKQGNADKAIEVYRKLSLLDPSKSPYFAAKISALNK